jgi:hypothetical protein
MKKNFFITISLLSVILSSSSCKKGCTDQNATNFDYDAKKEDGTCEYSNVTFYTRYAGYYNNVGIFVPASYIDVTVDGQNVGRITTVHPNGVGNCSTTGASYQCVDGKPKDWKSVVYFLDGNTITYSGTFEASRLDCIKIQVTQ